jgi:hypothetical protein
LNRVAAAFGIAAALELNHCFFKIASPLFFGDRIVTVESQRFFLLT